MKKTEFNELIEKAFSMGYEYALAEVEEKYFSEDEDDEKPKKKIRLGDRMDIWSYKNFIGKKRRKQMIEDLDEKESISKVAKREAVRAAKVGAGLGALSGGAIGYITSSKGDKKERILGTLKGAGAGAITGAAVDGGLMGLDTAMNTSLRRAARKVSKTSDKSWRKEQDKMKVADGQMSREEFAEKWGK